MLRLGRLHMHAGGGVERHVGTAVHHDPIGAHRDAVGPPGGVAVVELQRPEPGGETEQRDGHSADHRDPRPAPREAPPGTGDRLEARRLSPGRRGAAGAPARPNAVLAPGRDRVPNAVVVAAQTRVAEHRVGRRCLLELLDRLGIRVGIGVQPLGDGPKRTGDVVVGGVGG